MDDKRRAHERASDFIQRRYGAGMLIEETLFGRVDKVAKAIERLRLHEPDEGYWLAFSGGKDSCVIKHLAQVTGVKFDAHYSLTTVDPPEVVRFIRQMHPDVQIHKPKLSMWKLMVKKGIPPTRVARYCCKVLKEGAGKGRFVVTGVRRAESAKRANRGIIEGCPVKLLKGKGSMILNVIADWTENDVWDYIRAENIPYCSLYDEGFKRLGCIGCPLAGPESMKRGFERWPKFEKQYFRTFERMLAAKPNKHRLGAKDFMHNWIENTCNIDANQIGMFD